VLGSFGKAVERTLTALIWGLLRCTVRTVISPVISPRQDRIPPIGQGAGSPVAWLPRSGGIYTDIVVALSDVLDWVFVAEKVDPKAF